MPVAINGCRVLLKRGTSSTPRRTVPIGRRVVKTLARRHSFPALGLDQIKEVRGQVGDGLLDEVMLDSKIIRGTTCTQHLLDNVFGLLDRGRIQVILCIQIKVDPMISKSLHVDPTARFSTALRVRWSHVRRIFPNDVGNRSLVLHHLILADGRRDVREAVMRPSV